jgi:hypothetical protein
MLATEASEIQMSSWWTMCDENVCVVRHCVIPNIVLARILESPIPMTWRFGASVDIQAASVVTDNCYATVLEIRDITSVDLHKLVAKPATVLVYVVIEKKVMVASNNNLCSVRLLP